MARELNGNGYCDGCGGNFSACVGVYHCPYGCEEPAEVEGMNGFCKTLSAFFGPQQLTDCPSDGWRAIKVYLDGNEIEIGGPFDTEEEAEACAAEVHAQELADNGQFGVGS